MKNFVIAIYILILGVSSFWIFSRAVYEEPYIQFHSDEALIQLGVGMALVVLWLQLAGLLVVAVAKRWLHAWWLFALILIAFVLFYLQNCPFGYINDMASFQEIKQQSIE